MTELFINDSRIDLYPNIGVGITYQTANLTNLNARGGSFTNKFKVPLTANNKTILDNTHIVNSDSNYPYAFNRASIFIDGVEVLADGIAVIETTGDDSFTVNILSGNSDFFNLIKGVNLNDLDFSDYEHTLNATDFMTYSKATTGGLVYAFADWGKGQVLDATGGTENIINNKLNMMGGVMPSIYSYSLLQKIADYTGWTIDGNVFSNTEFLKSIFTCNKYEKDFFDSESTDERITSDNVFYTAGSQPLGANVGNFARTVFNMPYNNSSSSVATFNGDIIKINNKRTATYEFDFNLNLTLTAPKGRRLAYAIRLCETDISGNYVAEAAYRSQDYTYLYDSGYDATRTTTATETIEIAKTVKCTYYLEAGKYYKPFLYYDEDTTGSTGSNYVSTVEMLQGSNYTFNQTSTIYPLDTVDCTELYDYQIDTFLKDLILMYGLNLQANNLTKTLSLNYFNDLATETPEDWSSKVNLDKGISLSYKYGNYYQKSNFVYANETDYNGFITIPDLTLGNEGDVVKVSVDAINDYYNYTIIATGSNYSNPKVPIFENEGRIANRENENNTAGASSPFGAYQTDRIEKQNGQNKCYFLRLSNQNTIATFSSSHVPSLIGNFNQLSSPGNTLSATGLNYDTGCPLTVFNNTSESVSLDFQSLVNTYYQPISDMFQKVKVVSLYLDLTPLDIVNLDFGKPKTIINDRMNDNFYLLQVSNYKAGQSTKCTLIRL